MNTELFITTTPSGNNTAAGLRSEPRTTDNNFSATMKKNVEKQNYPATNKPDNSSQTGRTTSNEHQSLKKTATAADNKLTKPANFQYADLPDTGKTALLDTSRLTTTESMAANPGWSPDSTGQDQLEEAELPTGEAGAVMVFPFREANDKPAPLSSSLANNNPVADEPVQNTAATQAGLLAEAAEQTAALSDAEPAGRSTRGNAVSNEMLTNTRSSAPLLSDAADKSADKNTLRKEARSLIAADDSKIADEPTLSATNAAANKLKPSAPQFPSSNTAPASALTPAPELSATSNGPDVALETFSPMNNRAALSSTANSGVNNSWLQTPVNSPEWSQDFSLQMLSHVQRGNQRIALHLNPVELGPLTVDIKVSDQQAQLLFTSMNLQTRQALESAIPQLREILSEQGINLGEAMVSDQRSEQPGEQQGFYRSSRQAARQQQSNLLDTPDLSQPSAERVSPDGRVNLYV